MRDGWHGSNWSSRLRDLIRFREGRTMNLKLSVALVAILLAPAGPGLAQSTPPGSALAVEHSVPFGTIPGKLLLLGNYLVFVDEQQPNMSFVVAKRAIENLSADGPAITVQTSE